MKLSVVIVNYNVRHFLEQALRSVTKACRHLEAEVWVVDNNSVDDSVAMVRDKFPAVKLIANNHNPGFSRANNQAIRQASGAYVLLLNPDTVVEEDTFEKCLAFMDAHPEAGGLGVRMIDGAGKFLPESKRGFPTPWVAFCKTTGLSRIFPRSRTFNRYHLGYLAENEIQEVEVLSGAFMFLRRSALEKIGLLDEAFFMYGEDIDLSYRMLSAGYRNYYFPETTIIHYKGESTKKGSLNYVRAFYQAMIIFARKHFRGANARLFVAMLRAAIYLRAGLTLTVNLWRRLLWPVADAALLYLGLWAMQFFWANYRFQDPDYYDASFLYFNAPLYVLIWLGSLFFTGVYDDRWSLRRLVRGLLLGAVLIAAVYGFLDTAYRSSRALIVLGAGWAVGALSLFRLLMHFARFGNFRIGRDEPHNLIIIGSETESARVRQLLQHADVRKNLIGNVCAGIDPPAGYLGRLAQLDEMVHIYKVDEIIFCSKDISARQIMYWMSRLGPKVEYKILPEESLSIIGSRSRDASGELYTVDVRFNIAQPLEKRNKRVFDLGLATGLLLTWPVQVFLIKRPLSLLKNILQVLAGRKSWVGYAGSVAGRAPLPAIRPGVLTAADGVRRPGLDEETLQRLNFFYAKDYRNGMDAEIVWRAWRSLGRG